MKNNKGFALLEGLLILVIIGILVGTGWYVYQAHNKTTDSLTNADAANSSTVNYSKNAPESTSGTGAYAGWSTYTFAPENLKLKFPSDMNIEKPTTITGDDPTGASKGVYATALANGYHIQMELLTNPSSNSAFVNLNDATKVTAFTSQGAQYYVVNDGNGLEISSCADKVCTFKSHSNSSLGVLIFVSYQDPAKTTHQSLESVPTNDAYLPTVEKILESLSY